MHTYKELYTDFVNCNLLHEVEDNLNQMFKNLVYELSITPSIDEHNVDELDFSYVNTNIAEDLYRISKGSERDLKKDLESLFSDNSFGSFEMDFKVELGPKPQRLLAEVREILLEAFDSNEDSFQERLDQEIAEGFSEAHFDIYYLRDEDGNVYDINDDYLNSDEYQEFESDYDGTFLFTDDPERFFNLSYFKANILKLLETHENESAFHDVDRLITDCNDLSSDEDRIVEFTTVLLTEKLAIEGGVFLGFSDFKIKIENKISIDAARFTESSESAISFFVELCESSENVLKSLFLRPTEQLQLFEEGVAMDPRGEIPSFSVIPCVYAVEAINVENWHEYSISEDISSMFTKFEDSICKSYVYIAHVDSYFFSSEESPLDVEITIFGECPLDNVYLATYNSGVSFNLQNMDLHSSDVHFLPGSFFRGTLNTSAILKIGMPRCYSATQALMSNNLSSRSLFTTKEPTFVSSKGMHTFHVHSFAQYAYIDFSKANARNLKLDADSAVMAVFMEDGLESLPLDFIVYRIKDENFSHEEIRNAVEYTRDTQTALILDTESIDSKDVYFSYISEGTVPKNVYTTTRNFNVVGNATGYLDSVKTLDAWKPIYRNIDVYSVGGDFDKYRIYLTQFEIKEIRPQYFTGGRGISVDSFRNLGPKHPRVYGRVGDDTIQMREIEPYIYKEPQTLNFKTSDKLKFLGYLGAASYKLFLPQEYLDQMVDPYTFVGNRLGKAPVSIKWKLAKNTNFLASSLLSFWVPQMLARFEEHMKQLNMPLNKAPLGVVMDILTNGQAESPSDFLTNPKYGVLTTFLRQKYGMFPYTDPNLGKYAEALDSKEAKIAYLGAVRYLYSFIDFYTKPLAILYNVLLNPSQFEVRENPFLKETKKNLSMSYAIRPASKWLSVYLEGLRASQPEFGVWSHLAQLEGDISVSDVEREIQLWSQNATIKEYDDLFNEDDSMRFDIFFKDESYKEGAILPRAAKDIKFADLMQNALSPFLQGLRSESPRKMVTSFYVDGLSKPTEVDLFSKKLSSSIELFTKVWCYNIAPRLDAGLGSGGFFKKYFLAEDANLNHAVDLRDIFQFGAFTSGIKKIFENKNVTVADGGKVSLCDANINKNKLPYWLIHYSTRIFPRVKTATFGVLPSEESSKQTSLERLSLGAYISTLSFISTTYAQLEKAVNVSEFGPSICEPTYGGLRFSISEQTRASVKDAHSKTATAAQIKQRLANITRDYNICIGESSQGYVAKCINRDAEVFTLFDLKDLSVFACIYYENGKLYELNAGGNNIVGINPIHGTALFKYRNPSSTKIAECLDFLKAQITLNFLVYLNNKSKSDYALKISSQDLSLCFAVVISSFDSVFNSDGLDKRDYLPRNFVSDFNTALELLGEDRSEQFSIEEINSMLPSAALTEMKVYLERSEFTVEQITEYLKSDDPYFGAFEPGISREIQRLTCNQEAIDLMVTDNMSFDFNKALELPPITLFFEQSEDFESEDY